MSAVSQRVMLRRMSSPAAASMMIFGLNDEESRPLPARVEATWEDILDSRNGENNLHFFVVQLTYTVRSVE
jgi:hypothetical protein